MSGAADFFKKLQANIDTLEKEIASDIVRVEADNFHKRNFRNEGFTDRSFTKWPARKKQEEKYRKLLVKKGHLRRTATHGHTRSNHIDYVMPVYGKVHNEGLRAGRGSGFTMPKRQFLGDSLELRNRIKRKAVRFINERLKGL